MGLLGMAENKLGNLGYTGLQPRESYKWSYNPTNNKKWVDKQILVDSYRYNYKYG